MVYRYGGEEFSVLLPEVTPDEASLVAERLRDAIETAPFEGEDRQPGGRVTVSVGVALIEGGGRDAKALQEMADAALHDAKRGGRNRVVDNH